MESLTIKERPIYVISDLHVGNGCAKDILLANGRKGLLKSFLEHIDREQGRLIILGDFLELWRYKLQDIAEVHSDIFDQLKNLNAQIVLGNHDLKLSEIYQREKIHPLFSNITEPFTENIAGRRFKFMHGHEVDPLIPENTQGLVYMLRLLSFTCEFKNDFCIITNDAVSDIFLDIGEYLVGLWYWIRQKINNTFDRCCDVLPEYEAVFFKKQLRTYKMLQRFSEHKNNHLYDIVVTGHTHNEGSFENWYFNSGSWTGKTNNYIEILPDGSVNIYNWTRTGQQVNNTTLY